VTFEYQWWDTFEENEPGSLLTGEPIW
jgi:hypothetical protein